MSRLRRAALGLAIPVALGAVWETQRRLDARRIAADPEAAELERRPVGRAVEVVSADGTRLHAEVFGPDDAPTVVLAHGWLCSIRFWQYQLRDLSRDLRVVAYDQRGHGRSQAPHGGAYSADALADDLEAVLQATLPPGRRCVVAGHSMGGMTVVSWAGRFPDRVRERLAAAMLVSTGMGDLLAQAVILRPRWLAPVHAALSPHALGSSLPWPGSSTPLSHRLVRHFALDRSASPARVAFCERIVLECPAPVRGGFGRALSRLDLYESVPRLTVPTTVVVGETDRLTPPWHARRLAQSLPALVELVELPHVGHMAPVEAPDAVTARLRALVEDHLVAHADDALAASTAAG